MTTFNVHVVETCGYDGKEERSKGVGWDYVGDEDNDDARQEVEDSSGWVIFKHR